MLVPVLATLVLGAALLAPSPVAAEGPTVGERILQVAHRSLLQYEGDCFPWVRRVIAEATGRAMGFGYRDGYLAGGAIEVSLDDVQPGDVVQIANDANNGPGVSYPGLHTAIVVARQANGLLEVIDSNSQWDGIVRLRPNYNPAATAAQYGITARAYRFGSTGSTPPPSPEAGVTGPTATISADGQCLRLRSQPSTSAVIVHCLPDGSVVSLLEGTVDADGHQWRYVQAGGDIGWLAETFLTLNPPSTLDPTAPSSPPAPTAPEPGTATGSITGSLPTSGGAGLIVWGGGPVQTLVSTAPTLGCAVRSTWVTIDGRFVGYLAGAPTFVNLAWSQRYPDAIPANTPLIVICEPAASSAADAD